MPRRGSRPAGAGSGAGGAGVQWVWQGQEVKQRYVNAITGGMERLRRQAENFWRQSEWTQAQHPYMTGEERDEGFFILEEIAPGHIRLTFGSRAGHAWFEEFGHGNFPGHHPVRNVLDRYGYRMSDAVRAQARALGL